MDLILTKGREEVKNTEKFSVCILDCFKKSSWAVGQLVSGYPRGEVNWNWTFPAPKVQLTVAQLDLWQLDLNKNRSN